MMERPTPKTEISNEAKKTVVRKAQKPRARAGASSVAEIDYDYERSVQFANRGCLLVFTVVIVITAIVLLIGFFFVTGELDGSNSSGDAPVVVDIPAGSTRADIGELLVENDLISSTDIFSLYTRINGATGFLSGRYTLTPGMSYDEIISLLTAPPVDQEVIKITFGPGQTVYEFGQRCEEAGMSFTAEEFVKEAQEGDFSDISLFNYIDAHPNTYMRLEGYLAPDTYEFYSDASPNTVIRYLLNQTNSLITQDMLDRMEELNITVLEAITMASIIEKEASFPDIENQGLVSGVFWNRINIENSEIARQTLGSDSTYYYLRNWVAPEYGSEDAIPREIYNAYITSDNYENSIEGFPAGPICNPSFAAIEAAIWPVQHDYFYFLTDEATPPKYYYAETYNQHERNLADAEEVNAAVAASLGIEPEDDEEEDE